MSITRDAPLHDFPDRAIREILAHPQHLRSLLRRVVPAHADGFDCERSESLDHEFPLDDWRRRESDLLFRIPYRTAASEVSAFVCVLIEHQSKADPLMPLRTLLYAVLFWEKEWKKWEDLPTPRPPFRLTPVLPIVFHTAGRPWGSNRELADLLGEPETFHAFAPRWQPLFWDLASQSPDELLNSGEAWWQTMAVVRAEDEDAEDFEQVFERACERLGPLYASDHQRCYDLLRMLATWGLRRRPREEGERLLQLVVASQRDAAWQKELQNMTQTLAEWYIEEGEKKGEKKGKKEGRKEGRKEGQLSALQKSLRLLVKKRFQKVPEALDKRIKATTSPRRLQACLLLVPDLKTLDELPL